MSYLTNKEGRCAYTMCASNGNFQKDEDAQRAKSWLRDTSNNEIQNPLEETVQSWKGVDMQFIAI